MNCQDVESLMPLYVEGDLDPDQSQPVSAHLDSCSACLRLMEAYRESQDCLHDYRPPEFSDTLYEELRRRVIEEIVQEHSRPGFLAGFWASRRWRPLLAASFSILLLVATWAIYLGAGKRTEQGDTRVAETPAPTVALSRPVIEHDKEIGSPGKAVDSEQRDEPDGNMAGSRMKPTPHADHFPRVAGAVVSDADAGRGRDVAPESAGMAETGTLRIELQTSNPKIRIIWFARKGTGRPLPKTQSECE